MALVQTMRDEALHAGAAMKAIVLDIDGVVVDFVGGFARHFGNTPDGAEWSVPEEAWAEIRAIKRWWEDLPPLPGAVLLATMSPLPDNYYFLTARPQYTRGATLRWFEAHGIEVASSRVMFAKRIDKAHVLATLKPAAFLDDSIYNVGMASKVNGVDAYLMLQPYNEPAAIHFGDLRCVTSVREFLVRAAR